MSGTETIAKLLDIDPEVKSILITGSTNDPVTSQYKKYGFNSILFKPYSINELKTNIDELI